MYVCMHALLKIGGSEIGPKQRDIAYLMDGPLPVSRDLNSQVAEEYRPNHLISLEVRRGNLE